jgi:dTMP kinase
MPEQNGIFIVLEGADGSGKGTQFKLLTERLRAVGYDVEVFDFPRYEEPSSHFVRKYLNGEYGDAADISPYTSSLFFALDRYEAAPKIKQALKQGKIVLSNRYVGSNMAHQGGKFATSGEQRGFFIWEDGLEFQLLGIPRPTTNIFLRVPAEVSYELIAKKDKRSYTDKTHDQHEGDIEHLKNSVKTYDTLCQLFPKDFKAIECAPDGKLLSIADINDKIWEEIKPILPPKPPNAGQDRVVQLEDMAKELTKPVTEKQEPKKEEVPQPKIVEQASDGQLHITIKNVSMLAARKVDSIEGIDCQIATAQWSTQGDYDFYTPAKLPQRSLSFYKDSLAKIAKLHKQMLDGVDSEKNPTLIKALETAIPLAALVTVKVSGRSRSIANLIDQLKNNEFSEIKWLAEQIQTAAGKLRPDVFTQSENDFKNIISSTIDPLSQITVSGAATGTAKNTEEVKLEELFPKNEFGLLIDALYSYSTSSRSDIAAEIENWPYNQKSEALSAALNSKNSGTLDKARYRWTIIASSDTFRNLTNFLDISELQTQANTPIYGYDVPEIIELAGIDELYIESFNESLKLFSFLNDDNAGHLAEYALLGGYKSRWQFITTAHGLKKAKAHKSVANNPLLDSMVEKLSEHHPLVAEFIENPPEVTLEPKVEEKPQAKKIPLLKKPSLRRRHRSRKPKK